MTTLYHIKLSNGEELITELLPATNGDEYRLKNPMIIEDIVDPSSGTTAIVLLDYAPFNATKNSIFLNKSQVISKSLVDTSMKEYYKSSLDYSILYGSREALNKIKVAAENLAMFTKSKVLKDTGYTLNQDSFNEELDEVFEEEDDLDDFFNNSVTANTTIH